MSGGRGGGSFIRVIVTRRLAARYGLSGNMGSVSAFPATSAKRSSGTPLAARMLRTLVARPADSSQAGPSGASPGRTAAA